MSPVSDVWLLKKTTFLVCALFFVLFFSLVTPGWGGILKVAHKTLQFLLNDSDFHIIYEVLLLYYFILHGCYIT